MLKISSVVLGFSFVFSNSFAEVCEVGGVDVSNDPVTFTKAISESSSCYLASKLAEACAWGSSLDVQTVSAAYGVCEGELNSYKPEKKLLGLLSTMKDVCNDKYLNMDGTLYRSMNSYCHLSAIQWVVDLAYNEE